MKAILNNIRIAPKKAELVAGIVRNMNASEALTILKFTPKKGAAILYKVLRSAVSNAENNFQQNASDLVITKIHIGKGLTYKRHMPVSRGRAHPILKRTSNITIEVGLPVGTVPTKKGGKKVVEKVSDEAKSEAVKPTTTIKKKKATTTKAKKKE
jgi:large subunit ribosomal protein L22